MPDRAPRRERAPDHEDAEPCQPHPHRGTRHDERDRDGAADADQRQSSRDPQCRVALRATRPERLEVEAHDAACAVDSRDTHDQLIESDQIESTPAHPERSQKIPDRIAPRLPTQSVANATTHGERFHARHPPFELREQLGGRPRHYALRGQRARSQRLEGHTCRVLLQRHTRALLGDRLTQACRIDTDFFCDIHQARFGHDVRCIATFALQLGRTRQHPLDGRARKDGIAVRLKCRQGLPPVDDAARLPAPSATENVR